MSSESNAFFERVKKSGVEIIIPDIDRQTGEVVLGLKFRLTGERKECKSNVWFSEKMDQTILTLFLEGAGLQDLTSESLTQEEEIKMFLASVWNNFPYVVYKQVSPYNGVIASFIWDDRITRPGADLPGFLSPEKATDVIFSNRI